MDPSAFKKHKVSRGFTYDYFYTAAQSSKPTLVFLHGFPSSSHDWRRQVTFFEPQGFGLIVPDLLGYDGTDKPIDPSAYIGSGHAQDIIDILDAEGVQKAIFVAHDWGCFVASRIANYHPERAIAFAFLAVGYIPPNVDFDPVRALEQQKQMFGREVFGYWNFYSEEGADKLVEKNIDSALSIAFARDSSVWVEYLGPSGKIKEWIEGNKQTPTAAYISEEEKLHFKNRLLKNGLAAPLNWYKVQTTGISAVDDKDIPADKYAFSQPVFFAACKNDLVCLPESALAAFKQFAQGPVTIKEFDADHWILMSHSDEFNAALSQWIGGLSP